MLVPLKRRTLSKWSGNPVHALDLYWTLNMNAYISVMTSGVHPLQQQSNVCCQMWEQVAVADMLSCLAGPESSQSWASHQQQPRILLCGPSGAGQAHLGPSLLHALEALPVHPLGLPSLLADANSRSDKSYVSLKETLLLVTAWKLHCLRLFLWNSCRLLPSLSLSFDRLPDFPVQVEKYRSPLDIRPSITWEGSENEFAVQVPRRGARSCVHGGLPGGALHPVPPASAGMVGDGPCSPEGHAVDAACGPGPRSAPAAADHGRCGPARHGP